MYGILESNREVTDPISGAKTRPGMCLERIGLGTVPEVRREVRSGMRSMCLDERRMFYEMTQS